MLSACSGAAVLQERDTQHSTMDGGFTAMRRRDADRIQCDWAAFGAPPPLDGVAWQWTRLGPDRAATGAPGQRASHRRGVVDDHTIVVNGYPSYEMPPTGPAPAVAACTYWRLWGCIGMCRTDAALLGNRAHCRGSPISDQGASCAASCAEVRLRRQGFATRRHDDGSNTAR